MQLGPTRRILPDLAIATRRSCTARPCGPVSRPKPDEHNRGASAGRCGVGHGGLDAIVRHRDQREIDRPIELGHGWNAVDGLRLGMDGDHVARAASGVLQERVADLRLSVADAP